MNEMAIVPSGQTARVTVPDTLDLAERLRLAVHGIMGSSDEYLICAAGGGKF